ncbi:hypothetical protein M513_03649 [Trichuris suis]|uniref:ABC transporter domain-containing protein n=1 Tax=Trichuris suis TaxID=68888 RepID=A0A085MEF1_9BILA|nr:hypothetical protein M513_03649 [Trichuris suis]
MMIVSLCNGSEKRRLCRQLTVLLWKNYKIRLRSKILLTSELLLPLLFFLALFWIRQETVPIERPTCNSSYLPKGMPSIGLLPMLQTYFCTLANPCISEALEDESTAPGRLNTTGFNNLLAAVRRDLQNEDFANSVAAVLNGIVVLTETLLATKQRKSYFEPVKIREYWKPSDLYNESQIPKHLLLDLENCYLTRRFFLDALLRSLKKENFHDDFCNVSLFSEYVKFVGVTKAKTSELHRAMCLHFPLEKVLNYENYPLQALALFENITGYSVSLIHAIKVLQIAKTVARPMNTLANSYVWHSLLNYVAAYNEMMLPKYDPAAESFDSVSFLFCGQRLLGFDDVLKKRTRAERLRELLIRSGTVTENRRKRPLLLEDGIVVNKSASDMNSSGNFMCGSYYHEVADSECWEWLQSFKFPDRLTTQLFTLLRGFILVSPSSPIVKKMIDKWNGRLGSLEDVRNLILFCFENVKNYSTIFEQSKLNEGLKILAQMYLTADSTLNLTSFLPFGPFYRRLSESIASEQWKDFSYDDFAKNVSHGYNLLRCFRSYRFRMVDTETAMEEEASCLSKFRMFFSGIAFNQLNTSSVTLPNAVEYKIRMANFLIDRTSQIKDSLWNPRPRDRPFIDLKYTYFGFSFLQDILDEQILLLLTNHTAEPVGIYAQQFPSSCHKLDLFSKSIKRTLPMFMILSWIFSVAMILKCLVSENELHLKAFMRSMGVGSFANGLAWFIHFFTLLMTSAAMIIFVLKVLRSIQSSVHFCLQCGRILRHIDAVFLTLFLTSYSVAIISLCFFISNFFKKASQAAIAGAAFYFILFLPYPAMLPYFPDLTYTQLCLSCLLPQVAFGWGCTIISSFEQAALSLHWYEMFVPTLTGDHFALSTVLIMLGIDTAIYLLVPWCIGRINRSRVKKAFHYLLHPLYCFRKVEKCERRSVRQQRPSSESAVNEEKVNLPVGISIVNLTKVFNNGKEGKRALNNLNVQFYDGQIACLSIVCGLFPPSHGSVLIYGKQIVAWSNRMSQLIGYCPQYNVLFNDLTVKEHLYFYAGLKGVDSNVRDDDIEAILRETSLECKVNELASSLSGGMKRRLSIAIAFIGAANVIILDEPTTNVDPVSRRKIWDLLLSKRGMGRTILFSTHSFDEAEILSDRVALISGGQLKCCGSPLYLKSIYHPGYSLVLQKAVANKASTEKLSSVVTSYIPDALVARASTNEVQFVLPGKVLEQLQPLIIAIGSQLKELNCLGYGLSECSIEQIFHQETRTDTTEMLAGNRDKDQQGTAETSVKGRRPRTQRQFQSEKQIYCRRSIWMQIACFFEKRRLCCLRDWRTFVCYIFLPAVLVTSALGLRSLRYSSISYEKNYQQLFIDPMLYGNATESFFSFPQSYLNKSSDAALKSYVEKMILHGLGRSCYQNYKDRNSKLFCRNITEWNYEVPSAPSPPDALQCHCDSASFFSCDSNEYPYLPVRYNCANGLIMSDLTDLNLTSWLLMTEKLFNGRRYGGFSVATPSEPYVELNSTKLHSTLTLLQAAFSSFLKNLRLDLKALHPRVVLPSFSTVTVQNILTDMRPKQNYKIWFNNQGWAALPAYMMALSNARLHTVLPFDGVSSDFGISVINHPMPQVLDEVIQRDAIAFEMALCLAVLFSLCSCTAAVCLSVVEDKSSGMQQLLFVSGLRRWLYWIVNLLFDLFLYMLTIVFIIVALVLFNQEQYVGDWSSTLTVVVLFFSFGMSTVPSIYLLSKFFKSPPVAFMICALGGFFVGSVSSALATAFELLSEENQELRDVSNIMKNSFQFLPQYSIMYGWNEIRILNSLYEFSTAVDRSLLDWDILGRPIVIMLIEGVSSMLLLLVGEYHGDRYKAGFLFKPTRGQREANEGSPAEKENVLPKPEEEEVMLKVVNLSKHYSKCFRRGRIAAVDGICFEVQRGECLGLLGPNGAGKTTIFKMVTGEIKKSNGSVLLRFETGCQSPIGYCPQFDALNVRLTAKETLSLYAGIRGIKKRDRQNVVSACIRRLGLTEVADKQVKTYSSGFKRRLSAAVSIIGDPPLILFDEPTAGMDVKGKRLLWNTILDIVASGAAVLFTSNNMEECEVLCSRVGILMNGKFFCLDTIQALKNRYRYTFFRTSMPVSCQHLWAPKEYRAPDRFQEGSAVLPFHGPEDGIPLIAVDTKMCSFQLTFRCSAGEKAEINLFWKQL